MIFEKILKSFGLIQISRAWTVVEDDHWIEYKEEYTEDELSFMLAEKLGVLDSIDDEYEKKIFADLKETDGLVQYLRECAARDKDRYFGATTKEEQLVIRGGFARTMYLKAKIMRSGEPEEKVTKVEGVKYK